MRLLLIILLSFSFKLFGSSHEAFAKEKKVQEVNFDGSAVDGVVRTPDGLYLVQKRGIEFLPLYKVRKKFDKSIKDSVEYLR